MPRPDAGSQPSVTANRTMSSSPDQKTGIELPSIAIRMAIRSTIVFRFTAETMPMLIPSVTAKTSAALASSTVAGSRLITSPVTGSLLRYEIPRSPWSRWPTNWKY